MQVLSSVALWTSKAARAPKDKEHPYGHGKIETMGALTISSLLLVTGGGIAWHAIETIQACLHTILLNPGAFPEKVIMMCSGLA
jgi:divalent metal cation (Fe/Co/Zn/Cd) transporter